MSQNVLNNFGQSPPIASPIPNPTDFNALASMFQDIAQVLLRYGKMPNADTEAEADAEKSSQKERVEQTGQLEQLKQLVQAEESSLREQVIKIRYDVNGKKTPAFSKLYSDIIYSYRRGEFQEEIRCFHISASNVREEYELLHKYGCVNLSEFLHNTYKELSIMINLLSRLDEDAALSAAELYQVCHKLFDSMEKLQELQTHLENLQLVHKVLIPTQ